MIIHYPSLIIWILSQHCFKGNLAGKPSQFDGKFTMVCGFYFPIKPIH